MSMIPVSDLTSGSVGGTGLFDVLMATMKGHIEQEWAQNRIRGPEYSQVYLGSLTQILQTSASFLLEQRKAEQEDALLAAQIAETEARVLLVQAQVELAKQEKLNAENQWKLLDEQRAKMVAETALINEQVLNAQADRDILEQQKLKITAEVAVMQEKVLTAPVERELMEAQRDKALIEVEMAGVQKTKLSSENLLIIEQRSKVMAETAMINQQKSNAVIEAQIMGEQKLKVTAETAMINQQKANAVTEGLVLLEQKEKIVAETKLLGQNYLNEVTQNSVLVAQECKLRAEFDLLSEQVLKVVQETTLLGQKIQTEKAQTVGLGVDDDSVIGRQKLLYKAQTDGFKRDAEQKAAKLLVDSWNVRRTTDEGTVADSTNMLNDATIGRAVKKLMAGVEA